MLTRAELARRACRLRQNMTPAEVLLWSQVRRKQVNGYKFRRQHILYPYIVDFYCAPRQLAVEVDGPVHACEASRQRDEFRDAYLVEEYGIRILRFRNDEIELSLGDVLATIREVLEGD